MRPNYVMVPKCMEFKYFDLILHKHGMTDADEIHIQHRADETGKCYGTATQWGIRDKVIGKFTDGCKTYKIQYIHKMNVVATKTLNMDVRPFTIRNYHSSWK